MTTSTVGNRDAADARVGPLLLTLWRATPLYLFTTGLRDAVAARR